MDASIVVQGQIRALLQDLEYVEDSLKAPQITPELRERVEVRFATLLQRQRQALQMVQREVDSGQPLSLCWDSLLSIRAECVPIFRESLALTQGALLRSTGLDRGLCRLADALLDALSREADIPWERFTIVAESEFFADMAEIIRVRFPETSILNLAVAAHEFGHFVGPEIKERLPGGRIIYPFQDMLERERRRGPQYWSYLHEHFADLFATYALGPAYACTCLLQRFAPSVESGQQHPSSARRAYLILKGLEKLNRAEGGLIRPYAGVIDYLRDTWQQSMAAASLPPTPEQEACLELDSLADELYGLVSAQLPRVRYAGWYRANKLAEDLRKGRELDLASNPDVTLPDVLNTAWICYLQDQETLADPQIERQAAAWCSAIVEGTPKARTR